MRGNLGLHLQQALGAGEQALGAQTRGWHTQWVRLVQTGTFLSQSISGIRSRTWAHVPQYTLPQR